MDCLTFTAYHQKGSFRRCLTIWRYLLVAHWGFHSEACGSPGLFRSPARPMLPLLTDGMTALPSAKKWASLFFIPLSSTWEMDRPGIIPSTFHHHPPLFLSSCHLWSSLSLCDQLFASCLSFCLFLFFLSLLWSSSLSQTSLSPFSPSLYLL